MIWQSEILPTTGDKILAKNFDSFEEYELTFEIIGLKGMFSFNVLGSP